MTTAPTPAPENTTKPTTTATDVTANATPQQSQTEEPTEPESVEIQSDNREYWDDEVYNSLTPEQKVVYENASASSRASFNARVKSVQQAQAEGWTTDWGTSENFDDQWSQVHVGQ